MNNKRRFISLFSAVLHIIVLLIVFLFFGNKIAVNKSEFNDKNEFYSKCLSNYIVYGLSDEQKIEYSNLECVDFIYSYYSYETNLTVENNSYRNSISIYQDSNMANTPFDSDRLIEKSLNINPIYIDYSFAKKFDLKINDSIKLKLGKSMIDLIISGIYKTNFLDDIHIMILYDDYKSIIDSFFPKFKSNYSYIYANDENAFDSYLKANYIPKAFMLDRNDFESDIDYLIYLDNYNSKDYYNSVNINHVVCENLDYLNSDFLKNRIISIVLIVILILMIDFLIAFIYCKKLKGISMSTNKYKKYTKPHIISMIISIILGLILIFLITLSYSSKIIYINYNTSLMALLPTIISYVLVVALGFIIKYYFTYKLFMVNKRKKNNKNDNVTVTTKGEK